MSDLGARVTEEIDRIDRISVGLPPPIFRALRMVVDKHGPCDGGGGWQVCSYCAVLMYPPPDDPKSQWSDAVYPCEELREIAAALGIEEEPS